MTPAPGFEWHGESDGRQQHRRESEHRDARRRDYADGDERDDQRGGRWRRTLRRQRHDFRTAGQTLNTGITETTGAVNLTSTGGGVNVNTAIPDTTGAVTINAATAVNINQSITNLKTGSNLAIMAGPISTCSRRLTDGAARRRAGR